MPAFATNTRVDREQLLDLARERHRYALVTTRQDGRPRVSPVTGGVDPEGPLADPVAHAPASEPPRPPARSDKSLIRISLAPWGPYAADGFPTRLSDNA